MRGRINRTWRVVLSVLVLLVAIRLSLPYIVTRYVNNVLKNIEGYHGSIKDVDIHLYRGAYDIDSLTIFKTTADNKIPLALLPHSEFSVDWASIFNGALTSEVTFSHPVVNFIVGRKLDESTHDGRITALSQTGDDVDWSALIDKLTPLKVNRVRIINGRVSLHDPSTEPNVKMHFTNMNLDAINLQNVKDYPDRLPARIYLQARAPGNGQLNIAMQLDPTRRIPDADMDIRFENVDLKILSQVFQTYAHADIDDGELDMYSEVAVNDGVITGYIKPLFSGVEMNGAPEQNEYATRKVWESMMTYLNDAFERQKTTQYTTKIDVKSAVAGSDAAFLPSLWSAFASAFETAFQERKEKRRVTVALSSEPTEAGEQPLARNVEAEKSKKELRKQKRKEKREERRKKRREKEDESRAAKKTTRDDS